MITGLTVRGSTITYRLSEPARVTILLQRRQGKRWRKLRVLRQDGVAGRNRLRASSRARVGNRSKPARLRLSARAAMRLRHRR